MNDLKGIIEDLNNSALVDNDFFLKLRLSDEEVDKSYSGCTTEGEIIIMLHSQQQEIEQLKAENKTLKIENQALRSAGNSLKMYLTKAEKSGEWAKLKKTEIVKNTKSTHFCSKCENMADTEYDINLKDYQDKSTNYCPNCGTKMKGD